MIRVETDGALRRVIIDRPEKSNALTAKMLEALIGAVAQARQEGVRALVLTGVGTVFSAGADLDEVDKGLAKNMAWEQLSHSLATAPHLTVAALNGTVAGGAFGMVLACDLRVAVDHAKFFYPAIRRGILPQPSDPARIAALVGPSRARLLLMAGERWDAETALRYGLIDRMVAASDLDATVATLTQDALSARPDLITGLKALFRR